MKHFIALICGIVFMLHSINMSAQTFDASTFISKPNISKLPTMLKQSVHTFSVDAVMAERIFGERPQKIILDNFPTSLETEQTIEISAVPSSIDAKTIIM
ncbi:MAG: hypothetical protein ACKO2H_07800, partial [Bacteroidota bacterium]